MHQPVLVIAGMHRSGTSVMTSLLHSAGLFVGDRLMPAAESNPEGHFEDLDFCDLQRRALRANGLDTDGFVTESTTTMPPLLRDEAVAMIDVRRARGVPWGWKDPRNTLFIDFWSTLVPDAHWLFMVRSPWEVVDSLFRRGDREIQANPQSAVAIWAHYNRLVRDFVRADPSRSTVIDASQMLADPAGCVRRVATRGVLPLGEPKAAVRPELLTPVASAHRIGLVDQLLPGVLDLYAEMLDLAGAKPPATMEVAHRERLDAGVVAVHEWAAAAENLCRRRGAERRVRELVEESASLREALDAERSNRQSEAAAAQAHAQQQAADASAAHERARSELDSEIVRRGEHILHLDRQIEEYRSRIRFLDGEVDRERAAHRATEADRVRILRSNSMKVLRPFRAIRRLFTNPRLQVQMTKGVAARACRWMYGRLPISMETRLRHRASLAGRLPGLLVASGSPVESVPGAVQARQPIVLLPMNPPVQCASAAAGADSAAAHEPVVIRPSNAPVVSVVIPVHNQWAYTLACIRSLVAAEPELEFEVILADDTSSDETVNATSHVQGLVICRQERNLGFLRNCNAAVRHARGRYVLLLNNDTQVQPGALSQMVKVFLMRPDAGLVGARLVYPNGTLQEAGGIVWRDGSAWNYGRNGDPSLGEFNYLRETDYCSGACIMLPRELWQQLGGFDERYSPAYYEDTDLAFAVRAAGKKVYYQPAALVVHFEGKSHGVDVGSGVKARQVRNQAKFLSKWRDTLAREHAVNGQDVFCARDRSLRKPCILVIDHYVPQPDRDAGSRSMWCIMRVLLDMGLNVKFWPQNLRYDPEYARQLESLGVEIIHGNRFVAAFEQWIERYGPFVDYVLLSRPHVSVEFIDEIERHSRAKVIFYGHDLHHQRMRLEAEVTGNADLRLRVEAMRELEESLWRRADVVYYPSYLETDEVSRRCPSVTARTLPAYFFEPLAADPPGPENRAGILFVAGFAHPPNVDAARWLVQEIMPIVRAYVPGVHLWLAGSNPTQEVRSLQSQHVTVTGYVTDAELEGLYRTCRVAVVPLRFGAGVKHKVLEAMHQGLPLVTTPVGAQGLPGLDEAIPVHADAIGIASAIGRTLVDDREWGAQSARGREFVERHYSRASMEEVLQRDIPANKAR